MADNINNKGDEIMNNISLLHDVSYNAGDIIFQEGDKSNEFYLIEQGKVRVEKKVDGTGIKELAVLKAGNFFGEGALLTDLPRSATVIAMETTKIVMIKKDDFYTLMNRNPQTALAFLLRILVTTNKRLQEVDAELVLLCEFSEILAGAKGDLKILGEKVLSKVVNLVKSPAGVLMLKRNASQEYDFILNWPKTAKINEENFYKNLLTKLEKKTAMIDQDNNMLVVGVRNYNGELLGGIFLEKGTEDFSESRERLVITLGEQFGSNLQNLFAYKEMKGNEKLQRKYVGL